MRNYSYRATSSDWTKIYDASVTGDFNGFIQSVNGFPASIIVSATTPTPSDVGVLIDDDPINITISASDSENLYARIPNNGNASVLSMLTMPWLIVGGAAPVGESPTANPVDVSGVDGDGRKRSLLTDTTGKLTTVTPDCLEVSGSVSSADVLFTVDMLNYQSICVSVTSAGGSNTIIWEVSADGLTNWVSVSGAVIAPTATAAGVSSSLSSANSMIFGKRLRYFRARVSIYGSGTVSVVGNLLNAAVTTSLVALCVGTAGEGVAATGLPVTIAAEARSTRKTSVSNGQVVRPIATVDGRLIMRPHSIPENEWKYVAAAAGSLNNSTTSATIAGAGGAGLSVYITGMQLFSEALTNATELVIRDGASGTVVWRHKISISGMTLVNITFQDPIKGTANTLMEVATLTAVGTGSIYVNAQGYYAP